MKRIVSIILVLATMLGLAGCSAKKTDDTNNPDIESTHTKEETNDVVEDTDSSVDDEIVPGADKVLLKETSITNNPVTFEDSSGVSVLDNSGIKTVTAMYNEELGYFIKLKLNSETEISDKIRVSFHFNGSRDRELDLQINGEFAYVTLFNNKAGMSDAFYKLTAQDTNDQIGTIVDYDDFEREVSKRLNLDDYKVSKGVADVDSFVHGEYILNLKTDKILSNEPSNYEITIDGIMVTMPVRVSELLDSGFVVIEERSGGATLNGGVTFRTPNGNKFDAFIMNNYVTQIDFPRYGDSLDDQEGTNPVWPDFEMLEGINKDSTLDDIILRLGEPNQIRLYTFYNKDTGHKDCNIYIQYYIKSRLSSKGYIKFDVYSVLDNTDTTSSDHLAQAGMLLQ